MLVSSKPFPILFLECSPIRLLQLRLASPPQGRLRCGRSYGGGVPGTRHSGKGKHFRESPNVVATAEAPEVLLAAGTLTSETHPMNASGSRTRRRPSTTNMKRRATSTCPSGSLISTRNCPTTRTTDFKNDLRYPADLSHMIANKRNQQYREWTWRCSSYRARFLDL